MQPVEEVGDVGRAVPPERDLIRRRADVEAPELAAAFFVDGEAAYVGLDCRFVREAEQEAVLGAVDVSSAARIRSTCAMRLGTSSLSAVQTMGAVAS